MRSLLSFYKLGSRSLLQPNVRKSVSHVCARRWMSSGVSSQMEGIMKRGNRKPKRTPQQDHHRHPFPLDTQIKHLARAGKYDAALQIFERTKSQLAPAKARSVAAERHLTSLYEAAVYVCTRSKNMEKAEFLVKEWEGRTGHDTLNIRFVNTLMDGYGRVGKLTKAEALYKEYAVYADVITYNTLVVSCVRAAITSLKRLPHSVYPTHTRQEPSMGSEQKANVQKLLDRAEHWIEVMKEDGLKPDRFTYSSLIDGYGKCRLLDRAFDLLDQMEEARIPPNAYVFSSLLNSCGHCGDVRKAQVLYDQMQAQNVPMNVVTWTALVDAFARNGFVKTAFGFMEEAISRGVVLNQFVYASMISACGKFVGSAEARDVYDRMIQAKLRPREETFNALIDAYGRSGELEAARDTLQLMEREAVQPSIVTYNTLLAAAVMHRNLSEAESIFQSMLQQPNLQLDIVSLNTLMDGYGKAGQVDHARQILEKEMPKRGIRPDILSYTCLVDAYCRASDLDAAWSLMESMWARVGQRDRHPVRPSLELYNSYLSACAREGDVDRLLRTLRDMRDQRNMEPTVIVWQTMLNALSSPKTDEEDVSRVIMERFAQVVASVSDPHVPMALQEATKRWIVSLERPELVHFVNTFLHN